MMNPVARSEGAQHKINLGKVVFFNINDDDSRECDVFLMSGELCDAVLWKPPLLTFRQCKLFSDWSKDQ